MDLSLHLSVSVTGDSMPAGPMAWKKGGGDGGGLTVYRPVQPVSVTNGHGGPTDPHPGKGETGEGWKGREMGNGPKNKTATAI